MKKMVLEKFPRKNSHSQNSHTHQTPPWKIPSWKVSTWNILTHVFKYFHSSFLNFLFSHCHRYHWCYLKDCFVILCFKSSEVFTFVNICQNEVLTEERQLMKWMGIFQVRIFRGGRGGFQGGRLMGRIFWVKIFPRGIFLEPFFPAVLKYFLIL